MNDQLVDEIWKRHKDWSVAASNIKASISFWRNTVLLLSISGAFFATLSSQIPDQVQHVIAWMSAALLALIPVITPRKLSAERTKSWVRTRSASESLKSEVYVYRAQAAPYVGEPEAIREILRTRCQEIEGALTDLAKYLPTSMPTVTNSPGLLTPSDYLERRVTDQVNWYKKMASYYSKKAARFRAIEFGLAVAAAMIAAAAGYFDKIILFDSYDATISGWVAVLTTISGSLTSHVAASRFDHLVTSYSATAHQLRGLALQWPPKDDGEAPSANWSELVRQCEDAISKENESWLAKWIKEDK
jgi:hypothetical protein